MLIILVSFPQDVYVDNVFNNQTIYQFTSVIMIHFMNVAGVCCIIRRTAFIVYICLNNISRYKHDRTERLDEKPRNQKAFFQNLDSFYLRNFNEQRKCLTYSFC